MLWLELLSALWLHVILLGETTALHNIIVKTLNVEVTAVFGMHTLSIANPAADTTALSAALMPFALFPSRVGNPAVSS